MVKKQLKSYMCQSVDMPTVDILMLAYNHQEYIEQAIISVLMQCTKYTYRLIIGEDCSTDSTRKIVMDYYRKYPDKIQLLLWKNNVGMGRNALELIKQSKGKYVAYLEGDDYWTDPLKLEKQIKFLETHPEFIGTVHNVRCVDEKGDLLHCDFSLYPIREEHIYGRKQASNFLLAGQTASLVHRNIWKNQKKEELLSFIKYGGNGDVKMNVLLGLSGKIYYFRDIMASHRRVFKGDSWTAKINNKNMLWLRYKNYYGVQQYIKVCTKECLKINDILYSLFTQSCEKILYKINKENIKVCSKLLREIIIAKIKVFIE